MAGRTGIYTSGANLLAGTTDLTSAALKILLMTPTYVPNFLTEQVVSTINTNEIANCGTYVRGQGQAGRIALPGGKAITPNYTSGVVVFTSAGTPNWATVNALANIGSAVIYVDTGTDSTSTLLACYEFSTVGIVGGGGSFTITFSATPVANTVIEFTHAAV